MIKITEISVENITARKLGEILTALADTSQRHMHVKLLANKTLGVYVADWGTFDR